jgi:hypothetical protein
LSEDDAGGGTFSLTWNAILNVAPDNVQPILEDPRSYLLSVFVAGLLAGYNSILAMLSNLVDTLSDSFVSGILDSMIAVGVAIQDLVTGFYGSMFGVVESLVLSAGLGAPVAAVIGWAIPVLVTVAILNLAIGLVDEFVPVPIERGIDTLRDLTVGWFR